MTRLAMVTLGALVWIAFPTESRAAYAECETNNGTCELSTFFGTSDYWCTCYGTPYQEGQVAGNPWAGMSGVELLQACPEFVDSICPEPPPPPPPPVYCDNGSGECTIDNDPDELWCTCYNPWNKISAAGGSKWSGLDDAQLYDVCVANLEMFCGDLPGGGGSGGEESGGGPDTGFDPGESGSDGGDDPTATTGDDAMPTTGDDPMPTTGEDPTATTGEDPSATDGGSGTGTGPVPETSTDGGVWFTSTGDDAEPGSTTGDDADDAIAGTSGGAEPVPGEGSGDPSSPMDDAPVSPPSCSCTASRDDGGLGALALGLFVLGWIRRARRIRSAASR